MNHVEDVSWGRLFESGGGSGPSITVSPLSVTSNGTYSAAAGTAYSPVEVDVPNTYTASDEGRVVSNGALVPQTSSAITSNGTVDTTLINSVEVNVSGGGGSDAEDEIIMRTISGAYVNNRVTEVDTYAFYRCRELTEVSFLSVTNIGSNAFASCDKIMFVSFPNAKLILSSAFYSCTNLTSAYFPAVTEIENSAFAGCRNISFAFFPAAKYVGNNAFSFCSSLTTASFPVATSIGSSAFSSCTNLTTVSFPEVTTIGGNAFNLCKTLTTASFPAGFIIWSTAFSRCYNLISLYLTASSVARLGNSNAFTSTPIDGYSVSAGQYGSIYVPASLLSEYQAATNWTFFSSRFVGIE